jgi:cytoskeleton protein RodZ
MTKATRAAAEGAFNRRRGHIDDGPDDTGAPLTSIGHELRAARLARGDDLAKVSQVLKIRKHHLEALEEDRIDALPGRTYATGFIRAYADYLGFDPAASVERFKTENMGRGEETHFTPYIDQDSARGMPVGWITIAILLLALVTYGVYYLVTGRSQPVPVAPVPAHLVSELPPPPAAPPPTAAPIQMAPAPAASVPSPAVTATPAPVEAPPPPLPQGQVYGLKNSNPRIILRAHESTPITVRDANGMVYLSRTLQPGDTYRVPNRTGMKLTTPNAGVVEIQLDGSPVGFAGGASQPAQDLSLDPQAVMDRHNAGVHP